MKNKVAVFTAGMLLSMVLTSCGSGKTGKNSGLNSPLWSVRMAESEMVRNPSLWTVDFVTEKKWNYTQGLMGLAFISLSEATGNDRYFEYAKGFADSLIDENGVIYKYKMDNYSLDMINPGKMLFKLYDRTHDRRYEKVIQTLMEQLSLQPRTAEGGFWHKKVYPEQMWLDGLYMSAPFYAEYAVRYNHPEYFPDAISQFLIVAKHTFDPVTGLYRHAFDASKKMAWADSISGQAPHAWGRAMGWFSMAIVDVLDFIPEDQPGRGDLINLFRTMSETIAHIQDPETGGWYQVLDRPGEPGNYIETSCTAMFIYSMLKGVRKGYLDGKYLETATKAYNGLIDNFIKVDTNGLVTLTRICGVAGLGSDPYRDGSYEYYIHEVIRDNDPKGVGPFIMASIEFEKLPK